MGIVGFSKPYTDGGPSLLDGGTGIQGDDDEIYREKCFPAMGSDLVRAVHADGQGEPELTEIVCRVADGGDGGEQEGHGIQMV